MPISPRGHRQNVPDGRKDGLQLFTCSILPECHCQCRLICLELVDGQGHSIWHISLVTCTVPVGARVFYPVREIGLGTRLRDSIYLSAIYLSAKTVSIYLSMYISIHRYCAEDQYVQWTQLWMAFERNKGFFINYRIFLATSYCRTETFSAYRIL